MRSWLYAVVAAVSWRLTGRYVWLRCARHARVAEVVWWLGLPPRVVADAMLERGWPDA